jgi:hypothetical protein
VVFSKPPFKGPEEVVKYIGRYTHRCAVSNNRIIAEKDGNIEFWFKNTKKDARWEITSLPVMTFMERFLYHVPPKHFHRIRMVVAITQNNYVRTKNSTGFLIKTDAESNKSRAKSRGLYK